MADEFLDDSGPFPAGATDEAERPAKIFAYWLQRAHNAARQAAEDAVPHAERARAAVVQASAAMAADAAVGMSQIRGELGRLDLKTLEADLGRAASEISTAAVEAGAVLQKQGAVLQAHAAKRAGRGIPVIAVPPSQVRQTCPRCNGEGQMFKDPCTPCEGSGSAAPHLAPLTTRARRRGTTA